MFQHTSTLFARARGPWVLALRWGVWLILLSVTPSHWMNATVLQGARVHPSAPPHQNWADMLVLHTAVISYDT
jgi:hypothetical protein